MISKKILALVLVLCMILPVLPVSARTIYPDGVTGNTYTSEVTMTVGGTADFVGDSVFQNIVKGGFASKIQGEFKVSDDLTVSFSTTFSSPNKCSTYLTNVFPSGGTVAKQMAAEAATDEELYAQLNKLDDGTVITVTNGKGTSNSTADEFKTNIVKYLKYKSGGSLVFTFNATLTVKGISVDDAFVEGSFFFYTKGKINDFVDGTTWKGDWTQTSDASSLLMPKNTAARTTKYVKGPYAVYEAPATGTYDILALKRDNTGDSHDRSLRLEIAGDRYEFKKDNFGTATTTGAGYYWQTETTNKTINLVKGQKVVIRLPADVFGVGAYSYTGGLTGLAFIPRTSDAPLAIPYNAQPLSYTQLESPVLAKTPVSTSATTATVNINGVDVAVSSTDAESYYPNIDLADANGNYIEQPTVLDALVAATKQGNVELPFELTTNVLGETTLSSNVKYTAATPITYETTTANGETWPQHSNGDSFACNITSATEMYCTNSSTEFATTVEAPEAGEYYIFARGMGYSDDRYLKVKVNGADAYAAEGDKKFFYHVGDPNEKGEPYKITKLIVSPVKVALNKGENTVTLAASVSWIRMNYMGFIKADSYEDAVETANEITASKEAFNEYFAAENSTYSYTLNKITFDDLCILINGERCENENLDKIVIPDNAVIETFKIDKTNFLPFRVGTIEGWGGKWYTDILANGDKDNTVYEKEYSYKFKINDFQYPYGKPGERDALAGCYLNGYVTMKSDWIGQVFAAGGTLQATTGDDREVKVFVEDLLISYSASTKTLSMTELYVKTGTTADLGPYWLDKVREGDVNGDGEAETYAPNIIKTGITFADVYDASNLYVTNSSTGAARVTAKATETGYNLTCNKTVPVCLIKVAKNEDGTIRGITKIENIKFLDLGNRAGVNVDVAEGETLYVWRADTLEIGTTMVPLCAPLTK